MYKPYKMPVFTASPDVKVPLPRISKAVIFFVSLIVKPYINFLFGFAKIILSGEKILFDVFKRTLAGKSRCIIAFRHPDGREPQLLSWFFLFRLRSLAKKSGIRFALRPHAIFVYGYEVVRWGGWAARFFMPNVGAIPIHHTKLDSKGMARIFSAITEGPYPVALAPEGQVSYSCDTVPRLETGSIRIGFQAAAKLAEKDKNCPLEILPVSVHFRYGRRGEAAMMKLLKKIENLCGLQKKDVLSLYDRLKNCFEYILKVNEERYGIKSDNNDLVNRIENVVNKALEKAERMLGIEGTGEYFPRLYKVRHLCWDSIFIPDTLNFIGIDPLKRAVMDQKAGMAWHIARHQELADFGWYFRRPIPGEDSSLHEKVEYVQNLYDFANRSMGGAIADRVNIPADKVIIKAAPVINLSERLARFKEDKKAAVEETVSDLEKAYLKCIEEVHTEHTE